MWKLQSWTAAHVDFLRSMWHPCGSSCPDKKHIPASDGVSSGAAFHSHLDDYVCARENLLSPCANECKSDTHFPRGLCTPLSSTPMHAPPPPGGRRRAWKWPGLRTDSVVCGSLSTLLSRESLQLSWLPDVWSARPWRWGGAPPLQSNADASWYSPSIIWLVPDSSLTCLEESQLWTSLEGSRHANCSPSTEAQHDEENLQLGWWDAVKLLHKVPPLPVTSGSLLFTQTFVSAWPVTHTANVAAHQHGSVRAGPFVDWESWLARLIMAPVPLPPREDQYILQSDCFLPFPLQACCD